MKLDGLLYGTTCIDNNPARAKYYASQHPGRVVTATVTRADDRMQFVSINDELFYKPKENLSLPQKMGWRKCSMTSR